MAKAIFNKFCGQKGVTPEIVDRFVTLETPFVHRTEPLKFLEETRRIKKVHAVKGRKMGSFPEDQIYGIDFDKFR